MPQHDMDRRHAGRQVRHDKRQDRDPAKAEERARRRRGAARKADDRGEHPGGERRRREAHSTTRPPRTRCGDAIEKHQQGLDHGRRVRRAARQIKIDRQHLVETVAAGIAAAGDAARDRAGADRHDPARLRHRLVGPPQRFAHRIGDGARHQQQVGKARRRRKENRRSDADCRTGCSAPGARIRSRCTSRRRHGGCAGCGETRRGMPPRPARAPATLPASSRSERRRVAERPVEGGGRRLGGAGLDAELADDAASVIDREPLVAGAARFNRDRRGRADRRAFARIRWRSARARSAASRGRPACPAASPLRPRGRRLALAQPEKSPERHGLP